MIKGIMDWIDDRSGIRGLVKEALYEKVPGGARWRYVWGSCLTFVFFTQVVTGTLLWMFYAPSAQTAWESVYFLQYHVAGGWFLRGVHHYMAQAMIVLLVLHLMQVVIDGAYKAPRELNFWFGILMMGVTLALSLTGYLLPWDQKGYWATAVATNLMAEVPLIGTALQKIVVGGSEYGHHTLTRFFALHAGVLPATLVALVVAHIYLFRKHGIHVKEPRPKRDSYFWPDQVLKDAIACLAVLLAVVALTIYFRGAPLGPPADPSNEFPARPEWYFLFLFQLLKYVPAFWGAVIIPAFLALWMFLTPFIGKSKGGHQFNVGFWWALIAGSVALTGMAISEDQANLKHGAAIEEANWQADRVIEIADSEGFHRLAQSPFFVRTHKIRAAVFSPPTVQAVTGITGMMVAVFRLMSHNPPPTLPVSPVRNGSLNYLIMIIMFQKNTLGEPNLRMERWHEKFWQSIPMRKRNCSQTSQDFWLTELIYPMKRVWMRTPGRNFSLYYNDDLKFEDGRACIECHDIDSEDEGSAPDLTGYGSREWLIAFIENPEDKRFYGKKNDRMPCYGRDGKLKDEEIEILADWIRSQPADF